MVYCYDEWADVLSGLPKSAKLRIEGAGSALLRRQPSDARISNKDDHPFCFVLQPSAASGALKVTAQPHIASASVELTPSNVASASLPTGPRQPKRRAGPSDYAYAPLSGLGAVPSGALNVHCAALSFTTPRKTKRSDAMVSCALTDESLLRGSAGAGVAGAVLNAFARDAAGLPRFRYVGDVVRGHRLKAQRYKGEAQLLGPRAKSGFLVARGWTQTPRRGAEAKEGYAAGLDFIIDEAKAPAADSWRRAKELLPNADLELVPSNKSFTLTAADAARMGALWVWAQNLVARLPTCASRQRRLLSEIPPHPFPAPFRQPAASEDTAAQPGAPWDAAAQPPPPEDTGADVETDIVAMVLCLTAPGMSAAAKGVATDNPEVLSRMWASPVGGPCLWLWDGTGDDGATARPSRSSLAPAADRPWTAEEVRLVERRCEETARAQAPPLAPEGSGEGGRGSRRRKKRRKGAEETKKAPSESGEAADPPPELPDHVPPAMAETPPPLTWSPAGRPLGRRLRVCLGAHWRSIAEDLDVQPGDWIRLRGVQVKQSRAGGSASSAWLRVRGNAMLLPDYAHECRALVDAYAQRARAVPPGVNPHPVVAAGPGGAADGGYGNSSAANAGRPDPQGGFTDGTAQNRVPSTVVRRRGPASCGRPFAALCQVLADPPPRKHVVCAHIAAVSPPPEEWERWSQADGSLAFALHLEDDTMELCAAVYGDEALRFLDVPSAEHLRESAAAREEVLSRLGAVVRERCVVEMYLETFVARGGGDEDDEDGDGASQEDEASQSQATQQVSLAGFLSRVFGRGARPRAAQEAMPRRMKVHRVVSTVLKPIAGGAFQVQARPFA